MRVTSGLAHRVDQYLVPDPSRVTTRIFLPGEEFSPFQSHVREVVDRVLALPEIEAVALATETTEDFERRHSGFVESLLELGNRMAANHAPGVVLSSARLLLMGAAFTTEFAVEGAALCNPSVVPAPDQRGLQPGELRVVVSVRGIGEGHLSSLGFVTAIIGPGTQWQFDERLAPVVAGIPHSGQWAKEHFRATLEHEGVVDALADGVLAALPELFFDTDVHAVIADQHPDLSLRPSAFDSITAMHNAATGPYVVEFPPELALSQEVLMPVVAREAYGIEDARFVQFVDGSGRTEYRATYTAFSGHGVSPRLLVTPDFRTFASHRLVGPAAHNKGMALFPRKVNGLHLALCRPDGERTYISASVDGLVWGEPLQVYVPTVGWEILKVGNCGSPIETEHGWIVLTHGVAPMRRYSIGAMLLDRDDPTRVVATLEAPLLVPTESEREGYVPNVLYSCGGIVHDGILWIPYGVSDCRIAVAWVRLDELVEAMVPIADGG
jgi:predicted GH43/DUF377 family glycosyl hydrolase